MVAAFPPAAIEDEEEAPVAGLPSEAIAEAEAWVQRAAASKRTRNLNRYWPKPNLNDITALHEQMRSDFTWFHWGKPGPDDDGESNTSWGFPGIDGIRKLRYGQDSLPREIKRRLHNRSMHLRTGFTHQELINVVSSIMQNPPLVTVAATGPDPEDRDRALHQQIFATSVLDAYEEHARVPIYRQMLDNMAESGLVGVEFYETPERFDLDPEDGLDEFRRALPCAIRVVDPRSLYYDFSDPSNPVVIIAERKPRRHIFESRAKQISGTSDERDPGPFTVGVPEDTGEFYTYDTDSEIETIRYYDRRWFGYVVNGQLKIMEEHAFPDIPVLIGWGVSTGSSNISERHIGVSPFYATIERALNMYLTSTLDQRLTYNTPKMIGVRKHAGGTPEALTIKLSTEDDDFTILPYGVEPFDLGDKMRVAHDYQLTGVMQGLVQRQQMNPVATGQSPGADPAGYTVNSLQRGSQIPYGSLYENFATLYSQIVNMTLRYVKHNDETFSLLVDSPDDDDMVEWLDLTADDITGIKAKVSIDEVAPQNRVATAAHYKDGMAAGLVPKHVVMEKGYGSRDWRRWDRQIRKDRAADGVMPFVQQEVLRLAMPELAAALANQQAGGEAGGLGQEPTENSAPETGGSPAPLQPPQGGGAGAADQSGARNPRARTAGQEPVRRS